MMNWSLKLGAKAPLEWSEEHERVLELSDRLWDDLRERWIACLYAEREAERATGDEALLAAIEAHESAERRVDAAFQTRRDWRQENRRGGSTPEMEATLDAACSERRRTRKALWTERKRVRSEIRDALKVLWQSRDGDMRAMAAGKGRRYPELHYGQYNDILRRFQIGAREALKKGRVPRRSEEHRSRSIYRQIQAHSVGGVRIEREGKRATIEGGTLVGMTWNKLTELSSRCVRIEPYRPNDRISREWGLLHVPADSAQLPIRLPVRLHRKPPPDALIKGVRIVRDGREWYAVLSIQGDMPTPIPKGGGRLYAGINWRRMGDGSLRILDGIDERGSRVQVCLPAEFVQSVEYADELQGALDRAAGSAAEQALRLYPEDGRIAQAVRARDWRALDGILAREWSEGTTPGREAHTMLLHARRAANGDVEKYAALSAEILGDKRGRRWVEGARSKAIRRRMDLYRRCARWLAERYESVYLADLDGRKLARLEDPETGKRTPLPRVARRQRQMAGAYSLEEKIAWALSRAGGELVPLPAIDASHLCPICGAEMQGESQRASLMLVCPEHGTWDRDHALSMALWRESCSPEERESWLWHAESSQRSQAEIVRVDAEVEKNLRGHGRPHGRLRYVTGTALANVGSS